MGLDESHTGFQAKRTWFGPTETLHVAAWPHSALFDWAFHTNLLTLFVKCGFKSKHTDIYEEGNKMAKYKMAATEMATGRIYPRNATDSHFILQTCT